MFDKIIFRNFYLVIPKRHDFANSKIEISAIGNLVYYLRPKSEMVYHIISPYLVICLGNELMSLSPISILFLVNN